MTAETRDETRRRLHRETWEVGKHYAAALREAKARYQDYDATMTEDATEAAGAASNSSGTFGAED